MTYKFDIKKVTVIDLNGTDYRTEFIEHTKRSLDQTIGNLIYERSDDIDLADKARDIHASREIVLTDRERPIFLKIIEESSYLPIIKRAIVAQIKPIDHE